MSENKLVGSLVLRTIDIAPSTVATCATTGAITDNDFGYIAANGGFVTWKNVNIRTCLGGLYTKYKRFNLKLTASQVRKNSAMDVTDGHFLVYMTGLPFSPGTTYNTRFGQTNQACVGAVDFVTTTSFGSTVPVISGLVSFEKPLQDTMNITIELKNSGSNQVINGYTEKLPTTQILGHWSIICDIYGVE